ncbi:Gfo/Idh/MocA family protein [Rubinisphaera margarita]|uniref:Gfo/Idh/MocA family protein n=1 Tax=Rubinisphaera margarita TaxID=2909586 RepID=UPI001EE850D5|nr:Gfo/Idh/MocA family oxidoreductase [Rubinisphaera margarita]MCG6155036.1 Gfo/Idh/MocA family oxidoreductase [Rubinisphaera margarita]
MPAASFQTSRRGFLQSAAGAAALATFGSPAILRASQLEKLNVAFIAVGGRGGRNLKEVTADPDVNVVALCDVNEQNLQNAARLFPQARKYIDFRKLYEDGTDDIDAVVVSTPEHTHAYATMPALLRGKHVYCEKPLTHNVEEARLITQAAAKANVATQMGTQIHAGSNYRRVVEAIQSGAIGDVTECHVWVSRAWGRQSAEDAAKNKDRVHVMERPTEADPIPDYLNWDLWLGPAKERPFNNVYFPGPKWYRWWDFGNGTMSDLGSHWVDLPYWAMQLDAPLTVEAFGPEPHPEIAPASMHVKYEYGSRGKLPPCSLTWYQGADKPEIWTKGEIPQWGNGVLFIGTKGMLLSDYGKHVLLPEGEFKDYEPPEQFLGDSPGQHQEWVNACKNGTPTGSPFSYAGPLTEANHLGNVAFRAGQKIHWDAEAMKVTNVSSANQYLSREPRKGWSLKG